MQSLSPGDRVVSCITGFCGGCEQCLSGHSHRCDRKPARAVLPGQSRIRLGDRPVYQFGQLGAFAEQMLVHVNSVTKVPREMPLDRAALLGCAVVTGIGAAVHGARVQPGQTVAVIGCGGVGLNVIQGARLAGASRIIAVDIADGKLELARKFGATDAVKGGEDATAAVVEMTQGGVDHTFEVIGLPATVRQGLLMLRKGGQLTLIGVPRFDAALSLPALPFVQKEVRIVGSAMGSVPFMLEVPRLARAYLEGRIELDALVSQRIALEDINHGYEAMTSGAVARSVIVFEDVMREAASS